MSGFIDPNWPPPGGDGDATIIIYGYTPSFALGVLGCVLFFVAGLAHGWQLVKWRTWWFSTMMVGIVFVRMKIALLKRRKQRRDCARKNDQRQPRQKADKPIGNRRLRLPLFLRAQKPLQSILFRRAILLHRRCARVLRGCDIYGSEYPHQRHGKEICTEYVFTAIPPHQFCVGPNMLVQSSPNSSYTSSSHATSSQPLSRSSAPH